MYSIRPALGGQGDGVQMWSWPPVFDDSGLATERGRMPLVVVVRPAVVEARPFRGNLAGLASSAHTLPLPNRPRRTTARTAKSTL